mmetsp:Transcript_18802/g.54157  ORF Transcript_18802/g.54157 Transcript_18802/m.54157 type:complete len:272 (-) Transcript_18802:690-1505(-)
MYEFDAVTCFTGGRKEGILFRRHPSSRIGHPTNACRAQKCRSARHRTNPIPCTRPECRCRSTHPAGGPPFAGDPAPARSTVMTSSRTCRALYRDESETLESLLSGLPPPRADAVSALLVAVATSATAPAVVKNIGCWCCASGGTSTCLAPKSVSKSLSCSRSRARRSSRSDPMELAYDGRLRGGSNSLVPTKSPSSDRPRLLPDDRKVLLPCDPRLVQLLRRSRYVPDFLAASSWPLTTSLMPMKPYSVWKWSLFRAPSPTPPEGGRWGAK